MGIAENLVGRELPGRNKKTHWQVIERIAHARDEHEGAFYSVGYKVKSKEGREAFMKVTDLDLLTDENASFFDRTQTAIQQQTTERQILEHCRGSNMDRIALAIDLATRS